MSIAIFDTLPQPKGPNYNIYAPDVAGDVMYLGGWRAQRMSAPTSCINRQSASTIRARSIGLAPPRLITSTIRR